MPPRRKSPDLAVLPLVPGQGRPEPPPSLDVLEQRIWRNVVDALPPYWLDLAGQLILQRLVAQCAMAERREARLRELRARNLDDTEAADELTIAHGTSAKVVAYLLTQLRATPRSRVIARAAGPEIERSRLPALRPWEVKAGA